MVNVRQVEHPLIDHSLTHLRDRTTNATEFRRHASVVSQILLIEAARSLRTVDMAIETPLASMTGKCLDDELVVVPVLRAGLAMLTAATDFLPNVSVGFLGLERDEETAIAREYYRKLPAIIEGHDVLVLDPMLATGGSLDETVATLKGSGAASMTLVCIVAAPEGIAHICEKYPSVTLVVAAVDDHLDENKYIVPGLGDFGDRYFGTT